MPKKMKETVQSVGKYNMTATAICFVGVLISAYAFHVEVSAHQDSSYEALCDISEHMACTKVFMSEYGKGFGLVGPLFGENSPMNVPNGFMGIFFYAFIGLLCLSNNLLIARLQLILSSLSVVTSMYLAYILYFILYDFCVVCVTTYLLNIINLYCSYYKLMAIKRNKINAYKKD